jgi:hypothetical protein
MRPRYTTLAATCGALFLGGAGLHAQNPVTRSLQVLEERAAHNLKEAAEDMPENAYGFKPTPAQMTFGEVVLHVAKSNELLCGAISGKAPPDQRKLAYSKDKLVERLEESFDLCNAALEHADDTTLGDSIPFPGGRRTTRAAVLVELAADWADHYSQLAIYLRLNGVLPPTAKGKREDL